MTINEVNTRTKRLKDINIKKWYQKTCAACVHLTYENNDYCPPEPCCEMEQPCENFKLFPNIKTPNNCKHFDNKSVYRHEDDYWRLLDHFDKEPIPKDEKYKLIFNILDFNTRMGDYTIGMIL